MTRYTSKHKEMQDKNYGVKTEGRFLCGLFGWGASTPTP